MAGRVLSDRLHEGVPDRAKRGRHFATCVADRARRQAGLGRAELTFRRRAGLGQGLGQRLEGLPLATRQVIPRAKVTVIVQVPVSGEANTSIIAPEAPEPDGVSGFAVTLASRSTTTSRGAQPAAAAGPDRPVATAAAIGNNFVIIVLPFWLFRVSAGPESAPSSQAAVNGASGARPGGAALRHKALEQFRRKMPLPAQDYYRADSTRAARWI